MQSIMIKLYNSLVSFCWCSFIQKIIYFKMPDIDRILLFQIYKYTTYSKTFL